MSATPPDDRCRLCGHTPEVHYEELGACSGTHAIPNLKLLPEPDYGHPDRHLSWPLNWPLPEFVPRENTVCMCKGWVSPVVTLHLMSSYDEHGNETATPCDCWFGESHLGEAVRGQPVIGAAISAGDRSVLPGHETWSAVNGCQCGLPFPAIGYWRAHVESLLNE